MDSNSSTKQKQAELRSIQGEAHERSAPYCLGIFMQMSLVENRESTCFAPVDFFWPRFQAVWGESIRWRKCVWCRDDISIPMYS